MSVRQSLLAILDQGPCYGYQLRAEFDRRTGSTWPLNVGQIYNTLERLERDGLVAKGEVDAAGHVYYQITDAGRDDVRAWLAAPVERATGTRDELTIKLALAATLPGADVAAIVHDQRVASRAALERLRKEQDAAPAAETAAAQPGAARRRSARSPARHGGHGPADGGRAALAGSGGNSPGWPRAARAGPAHQRRQAAPGSSTTASRRRERRHRAGHATPSRLAHAFSASSRLLG